MAGTRRFWNRWTAMGAAALVVVLAWAAYHRSEDAYCSTCWARFRVDEYGFAWSTSARWPLRRVATLRSEPPESIRRFLPSDHVHDASAPGVGWTMQRGVVESTVACGGPLPGAFAWALEYEPEFATFLDARIADGSLDVATVRALIAVTVPTHRDAQVDERLLAEGRKLYSAFHPRAEPYADVWRYVSPETESEPAWFHRR